MSGTLSLPLPLCQVTAALVRQAEYPMLDTDPEQLTLLQEQWEIVSQRDLPLPYSRQIIISQSKPRGGVGANLFS